MQNLIENYELFFLYIFFEIIDASELTSFDNNSLFDKSFNLSSLISLFKNFSLNLFGNFNFR